jgi:hypothetical protein
MGGSEDIAPLFLVSALDGGEWSALCPGRFIHSEIAPGSNWIGDLLWRETKNCTAGNWTRSVQPAARPSYPDSILLIKMKFLSLMFTENGWWWIDKERGKWGSYFLLYLLRGNLRNLWLRSGQKRRVNMATRHNSMTCSTTSVCSTCHVLAVSALSV